MTFPDTPLPLGVEVKLNGVWTDITADVEKVGIEASRGRADEAGTVEPGTLTCKLDNSTGKYSPRNPGSPLYGTLGRNTSIRAWVKLGTTRGLQEASGDLFRAPDSAGLSVTGDLDLRVDLDPGTWRPTSVSWVGVVKTGSYGLWIEPSGALVCYFEHTTPSYDTATSTEPLPFHVGRAAVRASVDVDNGAGGRTVTFYTADTMAGPWAQLGAPVTTAGTVTLVDTTAPVETFTASELAGASLYAVEIRSAGTLVASPVFSGGTEGATSVTDGQGNVWAAIGGAVVTAKHRRFRGEVAKWPQRWGKKGAPQAHVPIEAAGVIRRLVQGASPVRSALYRGCSTLPDMIAYWSCEDGSRADRVAGHGTTPAGRLVGAVTPGAYSGIVPSAPILKVGSGRVFFRVPPTTPTTFNQIRFAASIPAATPDGAILLRVTTGGTCAYYDLAYGVGGALSLSAYSSAGDLLVTSTAAFGVDDRDLRISLEVAPSGANVEVKIATLEFGANSGLSMAATSATSAATGHPTSVYVNPEGADLGALAFGHLTVETQIGTLFDLSSQMSAWVGEQSDARITRLATENTLPVQMIGAGLDTQGMGAQEGATLLALLRECADTDGGVLYEPRNAAGLAYRSLESICRQRAAATITYVDNLLRPLEPVEDDQATRNLVSVQRRGGGTESVEVSSGPLGTATVGVYDEQVTVSLPVDDAARQQAGWRVHLGTVDEARYPTIGVHLEDAWWATRPDTVRDVLALDIGDRFDVTDLPDWLPPFPVSVIVQGITETITPFTYGLQLTCSPAEPYATAAWGRSDLWDNETTALDADITAIATSVAVKWSAGPAWTDVDGDFDVLVGGEQMTVTAVTGATSPQTFTVVRGVNGFSGAHLTDAAVTLYRPAYWAL